MGAVSLQRFKTTEPPGNLAEVIERDGAVIVEQLLEPAVMARFNADVNRCLAEQQEDQQYLNQAVQVFYGPQVHHVPGVAGKSDVFLNEILGNPALLELCDQVLSPNCATYQLNFADVIERGPGAASQLLHRDSDIWPHLPRPLPFHLQLASMVALGEFSAEMGATLIAPGSHRWEPGREATDDELIVAELDPGSAVIYLGSILHAGGTNNTPDRWRRGLHVSYCLGWLRTEENNYLTAPVDRVRHFSREVQTLLGYAIHDGIAAGGGFVGCVDWRDPLELIAEGKL